MDAISYAHSVKQEKRIKNFIANPDSTFGIVTLPKTIASGESATIPAGRVAVLPNVQVDGEIIVEAGGEVFIPSGSSYTGTHIESNNAVFDTLKVQGQNVSPFSGFKNLIINGDLRINQRGATSINKTANAYNYDRWYYDGTNFIQFVEDKNVVVSGTYTLSWVGTATATVDGTSVSNGGQVTLTANTQVEVKFNSSDFGFVQLEYGNKKTNFEIRPYQVELLLCQRYYFPYLSIGTDDLILNVGMTGSGNFLTTVQTPVSMRDGAVLTKYGTWSFRQGSTDTALELTSYKKYGNAIRITCTGANRGDGIAGAFWAYNGAPNGFTLNAEIYPI